MLRNHLIEKRVGVDKDFRWRGKDVSRIEGFSDGVFAFSVTLLVVSLEVPKTFDELLTVMRGFAAFGVCFLLLMQVWFWHYRFFRRYGLQDNLVVWLNALLLFVVVAYIYPLKFLFSLAVNGLLQIDTTIRQADGKVIDPITNAQYPQLMMIYGAGFLAVALIFAVLYYQAYRKREVLELNALETLVTVESIQVYLLLGAISVLSILLALIREAGLSGLTYLLIIPARTIHGSILGKQQRALKQQPEPDDAVSVANAE